MAKTKQQLEKRKREHDKKKKLEKVILKIGAEMTARENEQAASSPATGSEETADKS